MKRTSEKYPFDECLEKLSCFLAAAQSNLKIYSNDDAIVYATNLVLGSVFKFKCRLPDGTSGDSSNVYWTAKKGPYNIWHLLTSLSRAINAVLDSESLAEALKEGKPADKYFPEVFASAVRFQLLSSDAKKIPGCETTGKLKVVARIPKAWFDSVMFEVAKPRN